MNVSNDISVSAQLALQKRLDTIADNIANTNTVGFRAEQIEFSSLLSRFTDSPVHFATEGKTNLSAEVGAFHQTHNPLDVAVKGDAWLAVQTATGLAYTKDGRMKPGPAGELQTLTGQTLVDAGGAPVLLNPNAGPPEITRDGQVFQNGKRLGGLGLFQLPSQARLSRMGDTLVTSDLPAQPVVDGTSATVHQGFVENSNVNGVTEITSLISVSRAFDAITTMMRTMENMQREAIKDLGAN